MSLWSRLFGRSKALGQGPGGPGFSGSDPRDTLVHDPRSAASAFAATPQVTPWSATRLTAIFQAYQANPNYGSLAEARMARHCLSQFWLVSPVDQLDVLYASPIGACYRTLIAGPLPQEELTPEERIWKDALAERLMISFERPETANVLLAAMPYFAPGKMRVADPLRQLPDWLQEDYARLFDPELLQRLWRPAGLLSPAGQRYGQAPSLGMGMGRGPDLTGESGGMGVMGRVPQATAARMQQQPTKPVTDQSVLPRLSRQRGAEVLASVQSPEYLRRMNGLINLYVIDPEDMEVRMQLVELRRQLGQVWLDAQASQLEELYGSSSFGRLYRDLLASGFPRASLSQEDRLLRNQLARLVADMSQPGGINALMAALPFYPPGKIAFGGGEQHMPGWLVNEIATIYGEPQSVDSSD